MRVQTPAFCRVKNLQKWSGPMILRAATNWFIKNSEWYSACFAAGFLRGVNSPKQNPAAFGERNDGFLFIYFEYNHS